MKKHWILGFTAMALALALLISPGTPGAVTAQEVRQGCRPFPQMWTSS